MVLAAKETDVVVILIKVEIEIPATLGAFQPSAEYARLLRYCGLFAPCTSFQRLYLFPCGPVNNRFVNTKEDCPVFFRVFDSALDFIGLGIALEVDNITAIFL